METAECRTVFNPSGFLWTTTATKRSFFLSLPGVYGAQVSDKEHSERLECEEADARSSVQTQQVGQKLCFG
jgi:hypothetical protein